MTLDNIKKWLGFAIGFIILILVLGMIGGEKMANSFLVLIIIGAVVFNSTAIVKSLQKLF